MRYFLGFWSNSGELPAVRVGGSIRAPRAALEEMLRTTLNPIKKRRARRLMRTSVDEGQLLFETVFGSMPPEAGARKGEPVAQKASTGTSGPPNAPSADWGGHDL